MKRVLFLLLLLLLLLFLVPLILMGCTQKESFDQKALKEELKEEGINPKLPTKFPITIERYELVTPPHETTINEVVFKGEEGRMEFTLTIQPSLVEYIDFEGEDVTVNGKDGFYVKGPGSSIHWTDGDYHYILTSYSDENGTKEKMVETAESFQ